MIVDDHEIVRRGVAELLTSQHDLTVVAEAATVAEASRRMALVHPDLLLVDLQLPDGTGLDVIAAARTEAPAARSVVLTSFGDDDAVAAALATGAHAFVLKSVRGDEILDAVRAVAAGRTLLREGHVDRRRRSDDPTGTLTATERRVVDLIGEGYSNREIAERLGTAEKTVKNHVTSLLAKMGLQRRTQVAAWVAGRRGGRWRTGAH
ncbi:MAG TPA: response regulator transcription factor [Candidatus Ruania gallistercoris]|uniref:Response regulator transcription factor n=1 Tax=Candidatus Ruania gallistercoris TaxID=2838746 RepID=A0A9D2EC97_9MICO|nr:response regulator transcription factor [Candidatus Ruania gallistercoris]